MAPVSTGVLAHGLGRLTFNCCHTETAKRPLQVTCWAETHFLHQACVYLQDCGPISRLSFMRYPIHPCSQGGQAAKTRLSTQRTEPARAPAVSHGQGRRHHIKPRRSLLRLRRCDAAGRSCMRAPELPFRALRATQTMFLGMLWWKPSRENQVMQSREIRAHACSYFER